MAHRAECLNRMVRCCLRGDASESGPLPRDRYAPDGSSLPSMRERRSLSLLILQAGGVGKRRISGQPTHWGNVRRQPAEVEAAPERCTRSRLRWGPHLREAPLRRMPDTSCPGTGSMRVGFPDSQSMWDNGGPGHPVVSDNRVISESESFRMSMEDHVQYAWRPVVGVVISVWWLAPVSGSNRESSRDSFYHSLRCVSLCCLLRLRRCLGGS